MPRTTKPKALSSTITIEENEIMIELDKYIKESRSEFIRRVIIREATKIIEKRKRLL